MNLFGKISIILWLFTLLAFAIMFDWFGSRDIAVSALEYTQSAVDKLMETGDQMQDVIDVVSEDNETLTEAKEVVREKVE
ncbi:hypothetical protein [Thiomicrorhabdus arctica]|uniref:hypothetical protein n=1 Tax=Thiomicrorhabdus arctica TaxID=131540 RepID=UPI00037FCA4C|nr:hypothetical protein [Thiomicrorhabdus arctica]